MGVGEIHSSGPAAGGPAETGRLTVRVVVPGKGQTDAQTRHVRTVADALRSAGHQVELGTPPPVTRRGHHPPVDVLLIVLGPVAQSIPALLAAHLARFSAVGASKVVVLTNPTALDGRAGVAGAGLLGAVDAVLVHSPEDAALAKARGARHVVVAVPPGGRPQTAASDQGDVGLDGESARYVAAIETIAAGQSAAWAATGQALGAGRGGPPTLLQRTAASTAALATGAVSAVRTVRALTRRESDLGPRDLPDWVRPTDVLLTDDEAADVVALARSRGLPWLPALPGRAGTDRRAAAWAALGALAAVLRVRDGERRSSLVVDAAGTSTVFARWARSIGYAPAALRLSDPALDAGSLDVVVRLHPNGCTGDDVDLALAEAARLLRRGGLVSVTLPVHKPAAADATAITTAISPADLRAAAARADAMGLALVGDLDRDIAPLLGELEPGADALARLTFRRR